VLPSTLALSYLIGGTWVKQSIGLGTWTRNRHELLLFAVRGSFPHQRRVTDPTQTSPWRSEL